MSSYRRRGYNYNTILDKIKRNPSYLQHVQEQTEEMCMEAVTRNGLALFYVEDKTPDVCQAAVLENPHALNFVDSPPPELCMLAVSEDGLCIQFVENKTLEMCMIAVKQNGGAFKFIPEEFRTPELYLEVVRNDPTMLREIENQTEELCLEAIKVNPEVIAYVKNQTSNIIKAAMGHPNFSQNFIDFNKFKITSIRNTETGEVYTLDDPEPLIVEDKENDSDDEKEENNDGDVDEEIVIDMKDKIIYFEDLRKNTVMYIRNAKSIQDEIEKYIRQRYGKKCLEKAVKYFKGRVPVDTVRADDTFGEGAFFTMNSDNNYDLWLKTTTYSKGWWSGKVRDPQIQKIRTYSIIEEETVIN